MDASDQPGTSTQSTSRSRGSQQTQTQLDVDSEPEDLEEEEMDPLLRLLGDEDEFEDFDLNRNFFSL